MAQVRLGTSGWSYPGWRGTVYPAGLPASRELRYASRLFDSLEINRSFYSLLTPNSCTTWYEATPPDFLFALKGSRFITHLKKMRGVETALANFYASGPLLLAEKLGPVVWQLPATQPFDPATLDAFCGQLPRSARAAARLSRRHDHKARHGTHTHVRADGVIRHALEARHPSFFTESAVTLLREHEVALVVSDSPHWDQFEARTAPFMYVRLHGATALYASSYGADELARWEARIRAWHAARLDVYFYFDNDLAGHAVENARVLGASLSDLLPRRAVHASELEELVPARRAARTRASRRKSA